MVPSPTKVKYFRPIVYCSTMYKIVAMKLTNRIKQVLNGLIGWLHSTFIKFKATTDNILRNHMLFKGYTRKLISPRFVLKTDLRKTYDTLEWPFLKDMRIELGYPYKFVGWVMKYVSTVS